MTDRPRYSAFISYSHRDERVARRLHRRLEAYRFPARLRGHGVLPGTGPLRLDPIFRDRDELAAAADLPEVMVEALAHSRRLLVICSPAAAHSEWVGREIRTFRALRGAEGVLAALVEGEPETAFHPELLAPGADGEPQQPLAADFRADRDGPRLAFLKLVAGIADITLSDLVQRDAQRRIQRLAAGAAVAVAVAVLSVGLAVAAIQARDAAIRERQRSERVVEFMLTDLRAQLKSLGNLALLRAVNQSALRYYRGQDLSHLPPEALAQRATLLQALGEDEERRGNFAAAREEFAEAYRSTATLLAAAPDDPQRIYDHAQSTYWVGIAAMRLGDDEAAERRLRDYSVLAHRLARLAPGNPDWWLEAGYADSNLGTFALRRSADTTRAAALFASALSQFENADRLRPHDRDIQVTIADGYAWLADVARLRGDYAGALALRDRQQALLAKLVAQAPRDFEIQGDMVKATLGRARVLAAQGKTREALALLHAGREAAATLSRGDPEDKDMARQARAFDLFTVRTWLGAPAGQRPAEPLITRTLGDCAADRAGANNAELATFCDQLTAWRMAQAGAPEDAVAERLRTIRAATGTRQAALSERWLLNFDEDARLIERSARASREGSAR